MEAFRDLTLAKVLIRIGNASTKDLEELLGNLKPNPTLRIPLDFTLEGFYEVDHYSFDFSKDEYELKEKKKVEEGKEVVSTAPGCWLSLDTKTHVLTSTRPGKIQTLEGVKAFKYLGRNQVLVLKEEHEILDTDLHTILSTVPKGIEVGFPLSYSDKYIAFRNPHRKRLTILDRSLEEMEVPVNNKWIVAHCLVGSILVLIQEKDINEHGIASMFVANMDSPGRILGVGVREGPYTLSPIGSEHFAFSEKSGVVAIHKITFQDLEEKGADILEIKQILGKVGDVISLSEDMFITDEGTVHRLPSVEGMSFIVTEAFGQGWLIETQYPSLESLKEVAKLLGIPVSLDVAQIIAGFCVEFIPI
jgi:hypothetical protein